MCYLTDIIILRDEHEVVLARMYRLADSTALAYGAREEQRPALVRSYRRLMSTTRAVVRESMTIVRRLGQRIHTATMMTTAQLQRVHRRLREPLVEQVLHQTRARVLGGVANVTDKIVSVFEPHTVMIRKGKKAKPTEFGTAGKESSRKDGVECALRSRMEASDDFAADWVLPRVTTLITQHSDWTLVSSTVGGIGH